MTYFHSNLLCVFFIISHTLEDDDNLIKDEFMFLIMACFTGPDKTGGYCRMLF